MDRKLDSKFYHLYENPFIYSIRQGLVVTIPILLIGSFSLIFKFLPIQGYQNFLQTFANGFLIDFFTGVNGATLGLLSLYSVVSISGKFARLKTQDIGVILGAIFSSLCAFMIFVGILTEGFDISSFGARGMFTAVFSAIIFGGLYLKLVEMKLFSFRFYTVGADADFNTVMSISVPIAIAAVAAYGLNQLIFSVFGVLGLEAMFHQVVTFVFQLVEDRFARVILYVASSSFFWFFGIHGTNVLFSVEDLVFGVDTGILSKAFLDVYVLMGGCGTTISLLIAILIFSKRQNTKSLGRFAAFPMIFNINELMVFGLPIVYNLWFFIPFMLVPLLCIGISVLAIQLGIAPQPSSEGITWVTPLIVNAYKSTNSFAGCGLQIFNIAVGTGIYGFFLRKYEESAEKSTRRDVKDIEDAMRSYEKGGLTPALLELPGNKGSVARILASDLQHLIKNSDDLNLYYQPLFDKDYNFVGAEALARWEHPWCGTIYAPLLIALAKETNLLQELEQEICRKVAADIKLMAVMAETPKRVGVNITDNTITEQSFYGFLKELLTEYPHVRNTLCLELKEQDSVLISTVYEERIKSIRELGIELAVDDFSMGHMSVKYLQTDIFSIVKMDGMLIKDIIGNGRIEELVSSMVRLAETMDFELIAKRVETKEQKAILEKVGCTLYQGDLYSHPLNTEAFIQLMKYKETRQKRFQAQPPTTQE